MNRLESALPERVRALQRRGDAVSAHWLSTPGCDVLFVTAPAGSSIPDHQHETENVTVVVSGETILTTARGEHRYGPGEWYETSAQESHSVRFEVDTLQVEIRFTVPPGPSS